MHPDHQVEPSALPSETDSPLAPHHIDLLEKAGIPAQFAADSGVWSVRTDSELPEEFRENRWAATPAIVFPWRSPSGKVVLQLRPDNPLSADGTLPSDDADHAVKDDRVKYIFPTGQGGVLWRHRDPATVGSDTIIIAEGTKQSLAAARYATTGVQVLGMAGCWNWRRDGLPITDLSVALDKHVVVILDADAAKNLAVYEAGEALREALYADGALSVRFVRLPAGKKAGLDDVLASRPSDQRADYLRRLVEKVTSTRLTKTEAARYEKPADTKPKPKAKDKGDEIDLSATEKTVVEATDQDVADTFVMMYGDGVRFEGSTERWLCYHDGLWDPEAGLTLVKGKFVEMRKEYVIAVRYDDGRPMSMRDWLMSTGTMHSVLGTAQADPAIRVRSEDLDPDGWKWNARNKVIDLRTGQGLEHDPAHLMTMQSPVEFDPAATCPAFDAFIEEVLPNPGVRRYVQQVLGLAMVGEVREHILPVFKGVGRNGKGTLIRVARRIFGPYASGISKSLLVETKFQEHATIVATLHRRRLVTTEELSSKQTWNISSVKELTGGDTLQGRRMREDEFYFEPTHTLVMATNARPAIPEGTEGAEAFWSRYREIPFDVVIENPDQSVEDRIMAELPGVLNWLLQGLRDYLDNDCTLDEPIEVTVATASAKVSSDAHHRFLADEVELIDDTGDGYSNKDLFGVWAQWCQRQSPKVVPGGINYFAKKLCESDSRLSPPVEVGKANVRTWFNIHVPALDGNRRDGGGFYGDGGGATESASDVRGRGERSASDVGTPQRRTNPQVTSTAASDASDASDVSNHVSQGGAENSNASSHSLPTALTHGAEESTSLASLAAHSVTSGSAPASDVSPETATSLAAPRGPLAWHGLLRKHASVLDPSPPCPQCGTPCSTDPELHVFQLCPACTSGQL